MKTAVAELVRNRWFILAVLFIARGAWAYQFQAVGSVGPLIVDDLGISYAELGTLIGIFDAPGIIVALVGGYLGQRYGDKRLVMIGLGLMVVGGVLGGITLDFEASAGARVVAGAGTVLLGVLIAKMVADWFSGRELALAMAIVLASWPIGIGAALGTQGALAEAYDWRVVFYATAVLSLVGFGLIWAFYHRPSTRERRWVNLLRRRRKFASQAMRSPWFRWRPWFGSCLTPGCLLLSASRRHCSTPKVFPLVKPGPWSALVRGLTPRRYLLAAP